MAIIQIKRGLQEAVGRLSLAQGEMAVALDTGNVYIGTTSGNVHINPAGGTADTATSLAVPRDFSITGDASAPAVAFDGTANVVLNLTLATLSSLTPGTYTKVTVNKKGQVTAGTTLEISDLPSNIPVSRISGLGTAATANTGNTSGTIPTIQENGTLLASLIPDLSGTYVAVSQLGISNGVATLGSDGKVPSSQLPSYVDDVLEYDSFSAFPPTGSDGVIYIATDTNLTYRWSGSQYVEISPSLALGETSSTAFYGDKGLTAYNHSQITNGNPHGTTYSMVGAAPESHVTVKASPSQLGHIMAGSSFTVESDGTLTLTSVDGGTFA